MECKKNKNKQKETGSDPLKMWFSLFSNNFGAFFDETFDPFFSSLIKSWRKKTFCSTPFIVFRVFAIRAPSLSLSLVLFVYFSNYLCSLVFMSSLCVFLSLYVWIYFPSNFLHYISFSFLWWVALNVFQVFAVNSIFRLRILSLFSQKVFVNCTHFIAQYCLASKISSFALRDLFPCFTSTFFT